MTTRRQLLIALGAGTLPLPFAIAAEPKLGKVMQLGYLEPGTASTSSARIKELQLGLRALGHIEGQNIVIEYRFAQGNIDRFPELAAELVRLKPDCVLAVGIDAIRAFMQLTKTIPIVMGTIDADPVEEGIVSSLARPGGNVTGLTGIGWELAGKRLELLREIAPKASRVAVIFDPRTPASRAHVKETERAARAVRVELLLLEARDSDGIERAFRAAREKRAECLFVVGTGLIAGHRQRVVNLAAKARLPAMYSHTEFVPLGGLMVYASNTPDQFRRAAAYVDKILRGTKPADLPVEQPMKFELVINMKTAKAIGVTVPKLLLFKADRVIE